jgi:hypothetical protein
VRLVLDTNIIVSGFISPRQSPARLMLAVRQEHAVLLTSRLQLVELADVVSRPRVQRYLLPGEVRKFQELLEALAVIVAEPLPEVTTSPDPKDNMILATALAGGAQLIVSGDKRHLLSLKSFEGIPVVTAARATEMLELP